jgi:hypothetical protein
MGPFALDPDGTWLIVEPYFADFPAEGNGVKMFNEDPREDRLAERRAEPAAV